MKSNLYRFCLQFPNFTNDSVLLIFYVQLFSSVLVDRYYSVCEDTAHVKTLSEIHRERDVHERVEVEKLKHWKLLAGIEGTVTFRLTG